MQNLFIPPLGTSFILAEDWTFPLHNEYRNYSLFEYLYYYDYKLDEGGALILEVTLAKGVSLKLDRIYIRKGVGDYDSVTFVASIPGYKNKPRFWVKLKDANNIKYETHF